MPGGGRGVYSEKRETCIKCVEILQQTCHQQADIRIRSHGFRHLVDDNSVAS